MCVRAFVCNTHPFFHSLQHQFISQVCVCVCVCASMCVRACMYASVRLMYYGSCAAHKQMRYITNKQSSQCSLMSNDEVLLGGVHWSMWLSGPRSSSTPPKHRHFIKKTENNVLSISQQPTGRSLKSYGFVIYWTFLSLKFTKIKLCYITWRHSEQTSVSVQ